jgi:hypothetical protein
MVQGVTIRQDYNGLALELELDPNRHDAGTELLREFIRQHKESDLVLIPTGSYAGCTANPGVNREWWTIRKKFAKPLPAFFVRLRAAWKVLRR